jgi:hypothetical protein
MDMSLERRHEMRSSRKGRRTELEWREQLSVRPTGHILSSTCQDFNVFEVLALLPFAFSGPNGCCYVYKNCCLNSHPHR